MLSKIWFWLTHDTLCGWCHKNMHRALIPLPAKKITACGSFTLPRVTHGICADCFDKNFSEYTRTNHA